MKLTDLAKSLVYVSLAVFVGVCSYSVWTVSQDVKQRGVRVSVELPQTSPVLQSLNVAAGHLDTAITKTSSSVDSLTTQATGTVSRVNRTLDLVNKNCDTAPCGTLADLNRTLATFRGTAGTVEIAGRHWDKNLSTLDKQEATLFDDTHAALVNIVPVENELDKSAFDLDATITSPDVTKTIHNFGVISNNFGDMTTDANTKFHAFLYPPKCYGFKCNVVKDFEFVKAASSLAEPGYWVEQLLKGKTP